MIAFKKWDAKNYPLPATIERGPVGRDMLKQREHGWRAALQWVKTLPSSGNYKFEEPMCFINEELEK